MGAIVAAACTARPEASAEQRTITDSQKGYSFVVPPRWMYLGEEARSPVGTLFTIEVFSLVDADPAFLEGLPDSLVPQLDARTHYFFSVVGKPAKRQVTVGAQPALELTFPVQVRDTDPSSELVYWVVRRGSSLFVLRATYPPGASKTDAAAVREIVDSWKFTA